MISPLDFENLSERDLLKIILKKVGDIESKVDDLHDIIHGDKSKGLVGVKEQVEKNTNQIKYWEKWQFAAGVLIGSFGLMYSVYLALLSIKDHIIIK